MRPAAVSMMQKEKLEPKLVKQDWRQGCGDEKYLLRGISTIWWLTRESEEKRRVKNDLWVSSLGMGVVSLSPEMGRTGGEADMGGKMVNLILVICVERVCGMDGRVSWVVVYTNLNLDEKYGLRFL